MCVSDEEMTDERNETTQNQSHSQKELKFYLYPLFLLISATFLALTLLAFFLVPQMRNLHGKSIACQSGTLMIAFISFAAAYLRGFINISETTCKAFGKIFGIILGDCCNKVLYN
jgi:type II secretory pathway component PulF